MIGGEFALPGMFMGALGVSLMVLGALMDFGFPFYMYTFMGLGAGVVSVVAFQWMSKFFKPKYIKAGTEELVGKKADVLKTVDADKMGQVKVEGQVWSASGERLFKTGEQVRVVGYEGVHLKVEAIK
jgi:membrane protein implicated in regulation of membrane protease activity